MSDQELYDGLGNLNTDFARSIRAQFRRYGEWTPAQRDAAVRLVQRAASGPQAVTCLVELPRFLNNTGRKTGACVTFKALLANDGSGDLQIKKHRRGGWWITDGGPYGRSKLYGEIRDDGTILARRDWYAGIAAFLDMLEEDPAGVIARHGRDSNACCFCRAALTDAPSVAAGYGPVCARQYRLPWGNRA